MLYFKHSYFVSFVFTCTLTINNLQAQQIEFINSADHMKQNQPFSEATIVNDIVYLSGQIGTDENDKVVPGGISAETTQAMRNIEAVLTRIGLSKAHIFKCTCMLADINDWPEMSKAYKAFFSKTQLPARSAFAGSGLALGAKVEIECMASLN